MAKTLTVKGLLALSILLLNLGTAGAQAFWTETFTDQAATATNWVSAGTNGGAETWNWTNVVNAGMWVPGNFASTTAATGYVWFDSDTNGDFDHDVTLTGQGVPASATGKTNVHLRFYNLYRIFSAVDEGLVGVSTDGTTWTYHKPAEYEGLDGASAATDRYEGWTDIAVPEADGAAQVWVQFRWKGKFEYYWKVDDIELYEYVPPMVPVTFKVNMLTTTVDPAGVKIAGTFSGWADVDMTNDGNGVWSYSDTFPEGSEVLYKFKNGPANWEIVPVACGKDDGSGNINRAYRVAVGGGTLTAICYGSCDPCVTSCAQNPDAIICDNFDTYVTNLKLGPQSPHWTTWSGTEGTTEDGIVSIEQASTAPNSLKINAVVAAGGPQDVLLALGNKTSGRYELKWKIYVPTGKNAYYNIQNVVPLVGGAGAWNLDVFYADGGAGNIQVGAGASLASFTFPYNTWFETKHVIDLDNNLLAFYVNGNFVKKIPFPNNLGGIDFYGTNGVSTFYIDDVEYVSLPPVVSNVDICEAAVDITQFFGGTSGVAQVTGLYNNTTATLSASDPDQATLCFNDLEDGATAASKLDGTLWYTFTGDGNEYHIETVPCNATNYIGTAQQDEGDTQLAIFTGTCGNYTLEGCNDDLFATGTPDWRAGVDIETVNGTDYLMLIDGFNFSNVVATGEFCISVTLKASIDCAAGAIGDYTLNSNGFVCFEEDLQTAITLGDPAGYVLPNVGPNFGMAWALSTQPVPANTWPNTVAGLLVGATGFLAQPFAISLLNDGDPFAPGIYYVTPVVAAGVVDGNPATAGVSLFDGDVTGGCFFVGESQQVILMPDPDELEAIAAIVNSVPGPTGILLDLTPGGGMGEYVGDESFYSYLWSNGATTQDITVPATGGSYSVTVSDISECAGITPFVLQLSGATDPKSVKSLTLSPNPTRESLKLELGLDKAADVRAEIVNVLGQTLKTLEFGKVSNLNERIQLPNLADGTYFLRIIVDGERTQRGFVVSH